ncbi:MAG: hypothetical protein Q7U10_07450 [Thermodesulfovibrionia bacterium]|nr:hypothetical protein [Thermodesulfovibrionia bacterium]
MLSNKYFIFAIFAFLFLVAAYNIKFFSSKNAAQTEVKKAVSQLPSTSLYDKSVIPERAVISKDTSPWKDPFSIEKTEGKSEITVIGIIRRNGKSHALINGRVYSVNDAIGSSVIRDIKKESVVLSTNGIIKEIYLSNQSDIKETTK